MMNGSCLHCNTVQCTAQVRNLSIDGSKKVRYSRILGATFLVNKTLSNL
jgi:hypothetical protein